MIRASALYISLILSMLIVLVCGSVLLIGYTYRMENKKLERRDKLEQNLESGLTVVLQAGFGADTLKKTSLYGLEQDSVLLDKQPWGIYEMGLVKAWIGGDTLQKAFLIGAGVKDSLKVLYLADEDRPLSISGKSLIRGTAYLPKSGIKAAYVENATYTDKTLVYGGIKDSGRQLPEPEQDFLQQAVDLLAALADKDLLANQMTAPDKDSTVNSFYSPVKKIYMQEPHADLSGYRARGKVMIFADSSLVLDESTGLEQVILVAPYVQIKDGFKGQLQVFASDSIRVGDKVQLNYPSALLVLKNDTAKFQVRIDIGKDCSIAGQLFAYEKQRSQLMPVIAVAEGTVVKGEVYVKGYLNLAKRAAVQGSVELIRFMAKTSSSLYENYLIDVQLNRPARSKYYLCSKLFNGRADQNKVLCWLW
ncbi:hypothetical protein [Pedobacter heparinus]|uniref:hypothetical protein n=1 Tax=Pedobacter heparinus TaxID=984 RepID=UPI0029302705|nr:hypothetical protein [Pedobacter heparinus]